MSDVIVKWNGSDVKNRAKNLADKSTWEIGLAVLSDAKLFCARNYGYLAASLMAKSNFRKIELDSPAEFSKESPPAGHNVNTFREIKSPGITGAFDVFVGTAVDYGPYVEFGTVKMHSQPFLRPAVDIAQGKAPVIIEVNAKKEFGEYLNPRELYQQTNEAFSE